MCDCEMPEFFDSREPLARKQHKCDECMGPIEVGARYFYASGKWGGDFQTFKVCLPCQEMRKRLEDDCCVGFGGIIDVLCDIWEEHRTPGQQRWLDAYDERWQAWNSTKGQVACGTQ